MSESTRCPSSIGSPLSTPRTESGRQPSSIALSPICTLNTEDSALPKSFNDLCLSPTASMESEAPWYRYCRPTAPVPFISDSAGVCSSSMASITTPTEELLVEHIDQENLSPAQTPTASPPFLQPLTAVSNILQSPVMFGERLPKWSILRSPRSPHPSPSSSSAELLNLTPLSSAEDGEHNANAITRDSPPTPPVSVFDRRRSWFTSSVISNVARPTVLKRGPTMSFESFATRTVDFQSLKRSATNSRNSSEEMLAKKSRVHSIVPSERSAFLPVVHRRRSLVDSLDSSSVASESAQSFLPSSSI